MNTHDDMSSIAGLQAELAAAERQIAALKAEAVPCEPTKAMIDAGIHAMAWDESEIEAATKWVRAFWQAMYDAARAEKP